MDSYIDSNLKMAKELSNVILGDLEIHQLPISQVLMKAKRLARLLHDSDAQKWLDYEMVGYPVVFDPKELGSCKKYYTSDRPVIKDERTHKQHPIGLPHLESYIHSTTIDSISKMGATESIKMQVLNKHHELVNDFERIKTGIHNYVTEVDISLSVGDFAQDIFEDTRLTADRFIRENCPRSGEQLLFIHEKMKTHDPEANAQALLAVQNILAIVADVVAPAQSTSYKDKKGHERKLGPDQYVNRLFMYIEENSMNGSVLSITEAEMLYIFSKHEMIPERMKDYHNGVIDHNVQTAIIHMYLIIAEIAKIRKIDTIFINTISSIDRN